MMNFRLNKKIAALFLSGIILSSSCNYKDVADAEYPDQMLYMTTAVSAGNVTYDGARDGIYRVSLVSAPGSPYRYIADLAANRLTIPLGIGRSGVVRDNSANIAISMNADTIPLLQLQGRLTGVAVLPADKYTIPSSVVLPGGSSTVTFPVSVDLGFLVQNPAKQFAIAVNIQSTDAVVNPKSKTTILLVDTKFLFPLANFTSASDATNSDQLNFTNTSVHGLNYQWDFGDGTAVGTDKDPKHVYVNPGQYTVKLIALGVVGEPTKAAVTKTFILPAADFTWVVDPVTPKKINFVSSSTNAVKWEWDFGNSSTAPKPTTSTTSNTYTTSGTYNVKLTVWSDAAGIYKRSKTITVTIP